MRRIWRAFVAVLLVTGPLFWLPTTTTDAASGEGGGPQDSQAVYGKKDDPEDLCGSSNPRKQKKCRYNGWDNDNWWENDNNHNDNSHQDGWNGVGTDPAMAGISVINEGLVVELWKSSDAPALNAPLIVAVKGDGAQIARVWWWAEGPVYEHLHQDDMAHIGEQAYDCVGAQPCAWSWSVFPRDAGTYVLHARIRDVNGRELQTDWRFGTTNP